MKRRDFLKNSSKGILIPSLVGGLGVKAFGLSPLTAALNSVSGNSDRVLVLIFLDGGNDGLNTIIPLSEYSNLTKVRPHVIMPENKLIKTSGDFAFHPSMHLMHELYKEDRFHIVNSVGYPNQNFSHFRSSDIWMSGSDADEIVNTGWSGRFLNQEYPGYPNDFPNTNNPDPLAIEIGYNSSLLFQGPSNSMSLVINDVESFYELIEQEEMDYPDTPVGERLEFINLVRNQSQSYGKVVTEAAAKVTQQKPYPSDNYLAEQLKIVAQLIAGGLNTPLYLVRMDGFDTHDGQVESSDHTKGEHANLLKDLSEAVSSFMNDLDFLGVGDRVMGMTASEFGRRIVSNASGGTDHGSAAPLFLFGNGVKPGATGNLPTISANAIYDDNLEMQYDFRQVYASVFEQWFCVEPDVLNQSFLGDFQTLSLVKDSASCLTPTFGVKSVDSSLGVYPNPAIDYINIDFNSIGKTVRISVIGMDGKLIHTISNKTFPKGKQRVVFNVSNLPSGHYFCTYQSGTFRQSKAFVKM